MCRCTQILVLSPTQDHPSQIHVCYPGDFRLEKKIIGQAKFYVTTRGMVWSMVKETYIAGTYVPSMFCKNYCGKVVHRQAILASEREDWRY